MTPVTNKPPMPQAPGKGIKSFPTPVIDDVVITEIVNAWKGDYKPLDYGVKWDESPHASMQGSHPDHKLVFQDPASADGEWVKRIWVNDRVNQDSYNYAIKYSGGSQSHPIYIRTYIVPRDGYVPLPDLTPDDVYPTALLVEEEVQRSESELDSRYIKVVRVFETLQGPQITSFRYTERGDLETVTNQQVDPNTPPDPDGLFVTQSEVIKQDVSKGTKTTATVPSYSTLTSKELKAGLLGETTVTDDIVSPSTLPDPLSTTVITSSVEQTSLTKARKRTIESIGPIKLTGKKLTSQFGGGILDSSEEIVSPSQVITPDYRTVSASVDAIDSSKSKLSIDELPSTENWPTLTSYKDGPFNQRIVLTSIVVSSTDVLPVNSGGIIYESEPIDKWKSIHTSKNVSSLLGKSFTEYETSSFTFPALLIVGGFTFTSEANIKLQRPSQSGIFRNRVVTTYTEELPQNLEEPLFLSTVSFSCDAGNFNGVLHNCSVAMFKGQRIRVPQSSISSIDYPEGEDALIRSTTQKDQIGLYKTVNTYITLQ